MASVPTASQPAQVQATADYVVRVADLRVEFRTPIGVTYALNGVSLEIPRGKTLGVVGESGCGKSMTGLSILQLVPPPGVITGGTIEFRSRELQAPVNLLKYERMSPEMRHIRGRSIGMIFQEPMTSLNPVYTVGNQISEAVLLHQTNDRREAKERAIDILRKVGMPNPERIYSNYPHELSGGMRQRAMIAMALSCTPDLLIADEPTTALDVTTEANILDLMRELQQEIGMSIMFITHNLGVVAQMCDDVAVMYLGRVVEQASVEEIFYDPKHPYTISLLKSIPRLGTNRKVQLEVIRGSVPDPYSRVTGCPFHPRCPSFMPGICDTTMPNVVYMPNSPQHFVRCHLYNDLANHQATSSGVGDSVGGNGR